MLKATLIAILITIVFSILSCVLIAGKADKREDKND